MKKYVSLVFSMIFVLGNRSLGSFFPEPISKFVEIACIIAGAIFLCVFLSYTMKEQLKTVEQNKNIDKNMVEALDKRLENLIQEIDVTKEFVSDIKNNISDLKKLPENIYKIVDELEEKITEQVGKLCSDTTKDLIEWEEKIDSNSKSILREVKNNLADVADSIVEFESDFSDNIKKLSGEYENFQNITNAIIDKITLMSEKDNEIIRGLLADD